MVNRLQCSEGRYGARKWLIVNRHQQKKHWVKNTEVLHGSSVIPSVLCLPLENMLPFNG